MRTDTQLLAAYVDRGDRDAFDRLVARHYPHVYQVVVRLVHNEFDARDLSQEVFVKAHDKAHQVRDGSRFRPWLLRIAVNQVRAHWRRRKPPAPVDELQLAFEEARGPGAETAASRREFELELEKALERMPGHLKTPLVLHYYQGLSLAEVGEILELAKSTVQHRVNRAVARLRRRFARRNAALLLPLLASTFPAVPSAHAASGVSAFLAGGAIIMKSKLLVGVAALVFIALLAWIGGLDPEPDRLVGAAGDGDLAGAADSGGGALAGRAADETPMPASVPAEDAVRGPVVHTTGPGRIVGHVIAEATGKGLAGVRIALVAPTPAQGDGARSQSAPALENVYWSGADGAFVCDRLPTSHAYELVFQLAEHGYEERAPIAFRPGAREVDLGAVPMRPAVALAGRIVDEDGAPVAGATVTAGDPRIGPMPVGFDYTPKRLRGALARSDAEGRFVLADLAPGYHRVVVRKEGYSTLSLGEVQATPGHKPETITLRRVAPLVVVVTDPEGRPVVDAVLDVQLDESVRAGRQGFTRRFTWRLARTDERGRVTVADFPQAREVGIVLEVSHPAFTAFYETFSAQPPSPFPITLQPVVEVGGHPVRVRLRGDDGEAVTSSEGYIQISGEGRTGDFERRVPIAPGGSTTVEGIPAGEHNLYVLAEGYRYRAQTIEVADGPLDVDLVLSRGALARGTVNDAATGEPIAGATVRQNEVNAVRTDARGRFALHGLRGGRMLLGAVRVTAPGYLEASPALPFAEGVDELDIEVRLLPVSALRVLEGVVRDPAGRPVAGALLGIGPSGRGTPAVEARSGIDGRFAFRGVPPERIADPLRIRVLHPRYAPGDVLVSGSALDTPIEITLSPGRTVRGRVVDEAGTPVAGASVGVISTDRWWKIEGAAIGGRSLDSWTYRILPYLAGSGTTDAEGRFALTHLPEDALQVLAFGRMTTWLVEGGKTGAYVASGGADVEDVVVRVRRGWALRGRLEDPAGRPVAGVRVVAEGVRVADFTRPDGTFDLSPVFRDGTRLRVVSEDYEAEVEVARGEGAALRVRARPLGAVHGKVVDATGRPLTGARVALADAPGGPQVDTSPDGGFRLYRLPIGACTLEVTLDGRTTRVGADVRHGRPSDVGAIVLR